jgi:hypothetical protein
LCISTITCCFFAWYLLGVFTAQAISQHFVADHLMFYGVQWGSSLVLELLHVLPASVSVAAGMLC